MSFVDASSVRMGVSVGSLSDSSNFGARLTASQYYYGDQRVGPGRWVVLDRLGVLWTDDRDALQLARINNVDILDANNLRSALHRYAAANLPATAAFDLVAAEYGSTVQVGDLALIPDLE